MMSDAATGPNPESSILDAIGEPDDARKISPLHVQVRVASRTIFMVAFVTLLFWGSVQVAGQLSTVIFQLITAMFLAMASDPAIQYFQRRGISRGMSIATFFFILSIILLFLGVVFVPLVVEQTQELIKSAPAYVNEIQASGWYADVDERFGIAERAAVFLQDLPQMMSDAVGSIVNGLVNGVLGLVTILLLMIFLLIDGEKLVKGAIQVAPTLGKRHWWKLSTALYHNVGNYVAGRLTVSTTGALALLVMLVIMGMPSALPLALWMFLLGLIPMVGATIGSLPSIIVAFFYSDPFLGSNIIAGLALIVYIIVYQQIENAVIEPRIVGKSVALAPFIVFLSILIGGTLLGVVGALMAIPIAGVVQVILRDIATQNAEEFEAVKAAAAAHAAEQGDASTGGNEAAGGEAADTASDDDDTSDDD